MPAASAMQAAPPPLLPQQPSTCAAERLLPMPQPHSPRGLSSGNGGKGLLGYGSDDEEDVVIPGTESEEEWDGDVDACG